MSILKAEIVNKLLIFSKIVLTLDIYHLLVKVVDTFQHKFPPVNFQFLNYISLD